MPNIRIEHVIFMWRITMHIKVDWNYLTSIELFPDLEEDFKETGGDSKTAAAGTLKKPHPHPAARTPNAVHETEKDNCEESSLSELDEWTALVTGKKPVIVLKPPGDFSVQSYFNHVKGAEATGGGGDLNDWDDPWFDDDSSGSRDAGSVADKTPGKHPFAAVNGRELLHRKIKDLEAGINEALEAASRFPEMTSAVVNGLRELQEETASLRDIVYMVPLEDVMVRYTLCVHSYDMQAWHLKTIIDGIVYSRVIDSAARQE
jgi:hypothetical protein